jgi:NAD(P)-dependent dehydrogenase (short-subunit alcohol dehydrogenase family)
VSVVLITGTSTGIGLQTALAAARAGHTVVATLRNPDKAGALREAGLDVRRLDVTEDFTDCVEGIVADHGRIDAVINNAGAGHLGTIELETLEDVRQVMEVNFLGVVRVTKAVGGARSARAALGP